MIRSGRSFSGDDRFAFEVILLQRGTRKIVKGQKFLVGLELILTHFPEASPEGLLSFEVL